jgi:hypothetical protein
MKISTFNTFREGFLREIVLPEFGEDIDSIDENSRSPAAKELTETGAERILSNNGFLHFVHGLLGKYSRLPEEQRTVRRVSAKVGQSIKRLRDATKTMSRLQGEIKELDKRLANVLTLECRLRFDNAIKELKYIEGSLSSLESIEASHIHPEIRKRHDKTAGKKLKFRLSFKSLVPRCDYELDSLKKKAPQQWLIEAIDAELSRQFKNAQVKISNMTRYRIIVELMVAGGLSEISAQMIKQHFVEKRTPTQRPARNSQAT